jgi:hypothetical protein
MKRGSLYAWADAIRAKPGLPDVADHTWVTSYDAPYSGAPPAPDFWFCRGESRDAGADLPARLLVSTDADLSVATQIGLPNDPAADYGIRYGVDGVCHQMANRVLLASLADTKPVVSGAKLYKLSALFFGVYGRNFAAWLATSPLPRTPPDAE